MDELLQCYDEQGNPTESRLRSEVKKNPPQWWYATARIFVVNDQCQLMISKRGNGVEANPGKYQVYFGGHVLAGDSFRHTVQRELAEEAGLEMPLDAFFFVRRGRNDEKKVHFENFVVRFNGQSSDLHFVDDEVAEAAWMSIDDVLARQKECPDQWTSTIRSDEREVIQNWLRQ